MNIHPLKSNPDSPLWTEYKRRKREEKDRVIYIREHTNYRAAVMVLQRAAQRAGIKKKIHPHLFRHSRATYLAKHLTEAQMKEVFGWTQGSEMASIYVHLSGRDVDDALLKVYGVKKDEGWDAFVEQIKNILLASDRDDIKQPTTGPIAETGCGGFDREMAEHRKSIQAEEKEPLETWQKSKDGARGHLLDKWNATAE